MTSIDSTSENRVLTRRVEFKEGGLAVGAYEACPAGEAPRPALILIQEWWGVTPHIEDVARRYAGEGFLVVAPDLYDGVTTTDAGEAARLMSTLNQEQVLLKLAVVLKGLRARPDVRSVGVTGFCMGGTFALRLACEQKLEAAVPFYGDVPGEAEFVASLSCPLLFIGAEKDDWITIEKMQRLEKALQRYHLDGEVRIYSGASHAFFNDTRPEVYSATDAADAWIRSVSFFKNNLS